MNRLSKIAMVLLASSMLCGFTTADTKKTYVTEDVPVCSSSAAKTYMDYRKITNTKSAQYKYIRDYMRVDTETGLLFDEEGFIGVALGSYFGPIGTRYYITLDTGIVLPVVKVEAKADIHVSNGCEHLIDTSVIELVLDAEIAGEYFGVGTNGYVSNGNFNRNENFKGKIVKVELVTDEKLELDSNVNEQPEEEPETDVNEEANEDLVPEDGVLENPELPESTETPDNEVIETPDSDEDNPLKPNEDNLVEVPEILSFKYIFSVGDMQYEVAGDDENFQFNGDYAIYHDEENGITIGSVQYNLELSMSDGTRKIVENAAPTVMTTIED